MLSEEHKKKWAASALTFLTWYSEQGDGFLSQIVTGDETWVSNSTPESNQHSIEWRHTEKAQIKQTISTHKIMCTVFWGILASRHNHKLNSLLRDHEETSLCYPEQKARHAYSRTCVASWQCSATHHCSNSSPCHIIWLGTIQPPPLQPRLSTKWFSSVSVPEEVPCWPAFPQQWRHQRSSEEVAVFTGGHVLQEGDT